MQDLEDMLGFRPYGFLYYMWRYVTPGILAILTIATVVQMAISPAGYSAWVASEVRFCRCPALKPSASVFILLPCPSILVPQAVERFKSYPPWASAMACLLLIVAFLPLPVVFIVRHFNLTSKIPGNLLVFHRSSRSS